MPYRLSGKMTATSRCIHPGGGEPSAGIPKSPPPPSPRPKADDCKSPHFLTYHRARLPEFLFGSVLAKAKALNRSNFCSGIYQLNPPRVRSTQVP